MLAAGLQRTLPDAPDPDGAAMSWLTDTKIPVGKVAGGAFDWLQDNGAWFFDGLSDAMEAFIDAVLWVLQTPSPFLIIACFVALTWVLQRNWKICLFIALGFLFILNQGYWEETTESLTLVLAACVVCMGVGVPIGIAAAHRPRLVPGDAAGAGPDADAADVRLSDPGDCFLRDRDGAGSYFHGDLCAAGADTADTSGGVDDADAVAGGSAGIRGDAAARRCGRWSYLTRFRRSWRG